MPPSGWPSSRATAINNREMVAGYGDSPEGRRSFLRSGATYDILSFPGWTATEAASLNDLGQVAGSGSTASGETHAFVAFPAGAPAARGPGPGAAGAAGGGRAGAGGVRGGGRGHRGQRGGASWPRAARYATRGLPSRGTCSSCIPPSCFSAGGNLPYSPRIFTRTLFLPPPPTTPQQ